MSESPFIANVTEATFEKEVLERSMNMLVVVDFWAGWCNPCKMLMPILSSLAEELNGEFFLAKIDTDAERSLAEKYSIRSLPTVRFIKQGQIVDEFNGALPAQEVRLFIEKNKFQETDTKLHEANEAFNANQLDTASKLLTDILDKDENNRSARLLQVKISLKKGDFETVDDFLSHVPLNEADDEDIKEIAALNEFGKGTINAPSIDELTKQLENNQDIDKHYQLACHYALQKEYEKAMDNFLVVMKLDRKYKDDGARKSILGIFGLLGGSGPTVNLYRIKMSRLLH